MDWKYECRSQISGLIIILVTSASILFAQKAGVDKNLIDNYSDKIIAKGHALDSIKGELERGRDRIKELDKEEGSFLKHLERLEKNIDASQSYLVTIKGSIDTLSLHIDVLKDSLALVSHALDIRQKKMKKRLRNIYKTGRPEIFEIILSSGNISDLLHRVKYFQELNRYDRMLVYNIDSTKKVVSEQKLRLEIEQEELLSLKSGKEEEQRSLFTEKKKRKKVLGKVKKEKTAYVTMVKELVQAQEELNLLLKLLKKKRKKAKVEFEQSLKIAFQKRKGKLPWPVDGKITRKYGKIVHPVYKTTTMCNGIDIKAPEGKTIHCVAPGRVDYIGWMRGYGKFIIINHFGDYLTIYAHCNTIIVKQDQDVKYGTKLGLIGETGSLNGSKLHFQIRHASKTVNPMNWLEKKE